MLKKLMRILFVILVIFSCSGKSQTITADDVPSLVNRFLSMHALHHSFTDTLSERMLLNYINSFDVGKYYFYQSDIDTFLTHQHKLKTYMENSDYTLMYTIHSIFLERMKERITYMKEALKQDFDFTTDEYIISDRSTVPYAENDNDMDERWRKKIKLQLLNYVASGESLKSAKEKVWKRYERTEKRMKEMDDEKIIAQYVNAFSNALDPHSTYLTHDDHEDFRINMELKLEGIGARLSSEDGFVKIESLIPGGPADKMSEEFKPFPNDKIVAVAQGNGEPENVINMDLRDVVKKIRGPKGTEVRLTVIRENPETGTTSRRVIPIIREEVQLKDSAANSKVHTLPYQGKNVTIGYLKLPSFYQDNDSGQSSSTDTMKHLDQLKKQKVSIIVLDLRGNPGGLLNEAIDIAGLFIDQGPIVQVKDGHNDPMVMTNRNRGILYNGPLVVLIDKFSASASEILAGAIRDYDRGLIIGSAPTFGKGTVQSYNVLPNKLGAVKITTHIFYQPGGTSNQLNGIPPHITVPELSSLWDIGESKTRNPLEWIPIAPANYSSYGRVTTSMVKRLEAQSQKRIENDKDFKKLIERLDKFKKQIEKKTISLKEESALNKEREEEIKKLRTHTNDDTLIDLDQDHFLREAFNISADYLQLLRR